MRPLSPFVSRPLLALSLIVSSSFGQAATLTQDNGAPVGDNQNSQTAGPSGPTLLQDIQLLQKLQRFDRERIPERVVHARGAGAEGVFVSSEGLADVSRAMVFQKGKQTPVFVRFSTVIGSRGAPETDRDPRGFATKFYTEQGNWDLVGNNLPVFFIRDAIKFPDMVHSLKPDPVTNAQDPNRYFDFFSHIPESTHMLTRLFSNYGTPASYREMNGSSVHALKLLSADGRYQYAKFSWKSRQGERNLRANELPALQGKSVGHATADLVQAITDKRYPAWDLYVQLIKPEDMNRFEFNPLDPTKVWSNIAERKVGTMTLNKIPANFFEATEQVAMSPANLVPGIEASEDKLLQGRLFSYLDTQTHRVGTNFQALPVNRPRVAVANNNQDGAQNASGRQGGINYEPSRLAGLKQDPQFRASQLPLQGSTQQAAISKTLNFKQAGEFYRSLSTQEQADLIRNLAGDLVQVRNLETRDTMLSHFYKADAEYGTRLAQALQVNISTIQQRASLLKE
ncbi:catalase [Neisseriaceae bacterium TC5R-5]|nr:catalase [Neisseriaceae bacterium TC5R-5]